ncbi:ATP-binding protein [Flavivirga abyssicola]|uniref:ATP-binding protein n=1 Tax=Flavivirga abyssicola TaxID=3063533 RepID=UPI0026DF9945|nr:ATP-binding protein [Flavivirga sp. MEBiC07777]WVK13924.1 ATP-binding protein [Flavivirga sp. MEBiC07777]
MKTSLLVCFLCAINLSFSQDDKHMIFYIDSLNSDALSFYDNNKIIPALSSINESKRLSSLINDIYGNALANFIQGQIYSSIEEYDAAESRFINSLNSSLEIDDNYLIAKSYLNLGKLYRRKKSFYEVNSYFQNALRYASLGNVKDHNNLDKQQNVLFDIQINLSQICLENDLTEKALIYLLRAEGNIYNYSADANDYAYLRYTQGLYFISKELFNSANKKFNEALTFLEVSDKENREYYNSLLLDVYEKIALSLNKQDLDEQAYIALQKYNDYVYVHTDKVMSERKSIVKSKLLIEDYKKDAQIANTERIQQVEITNKVKNLNIIISIALFLFIVSLIAVYKSYVSKRKLTNILKDRNEELEIARNEAVKTSELKSKFISNVTHELRTPLYGVVGITSLLLENNDLRESDAKLINSLKYSGDYLLNLINDILQVSKIESQKIELKNTSVNLKKLIKNIVDSFDFRLRETNNKINFLIDQRLPEYIKCDNVRLSQILINLIGNSIKFTENGRIDLRVKMISVNTNEVNIRFEIEDDGCGIPKHKFDTVFDNFSQLDENNNINYQGTGLGLSITKKLVELFDSKIELESEVGVGSVFSFNITFNIDEAEVEKSKLKSKNELELKSLNKTYKILIVEDNKINQVVTQNLLKKANYESVIVNNGLEALNIVKANKFDLILMDINMPIMNGKEATRYIREFDTQIPIIALTASDVDSIKKDCDDDGISFNDIIYKPFDTYEFYQIIETNIQLSKTCKLPDNDGQLKSLLAV